MLIEELKLDKNKYYFLCAAGIGDTMIVCGFYQALKKKYNADIVIVVPEKQEFIPKMFLIKDYMAVDLGVNGVDELLYKYTKLSDKSPQPVKGNFFLANFCFHNEMQELTIPLYYRKSKKNFIIMYKNFLHLPLDTPFENFKSVPELSPKTKNSVLNIAPFDKIILLSPEATSTELISEKFWQQKVQELTAQGYTVICNVKDKNNIILGSNYIPLSLQDSVALAYKCYAVYSVRSGFCDLCYQLDDKLNVYYANRDELYLYSLNSMFNKNINEYVEYNLPEKLIRGELSNKQDVDSTSFFEEIKYQLFFFIPLLRIKKKSNTIRIYLFGIPVIKVKRKNA